MGRSILSILAGIATGVLTIFFVEMINTSIYPIPTDVDIADPVQMNSYIASLSNTAFGLIVLAHVLGAFVAAMIAGMVSRSKRLSKGLIAGGLILLFTIFNLVAIKHPPFVMVSDLVLTALAGFLGARFGASRQVG